MIQDDLLGDFNLADEDVFDVQTITDAMMTPAQSLTELGLRFFLNLLVCWIIVQFFYYRKSRRRDYYFTFMVFSSAMVLLLYMMGNAEVGIGLTLGLFAIFGVIRYRTETVPIREMTYLFVIIALAALNGLSPIYHLVGDVTDHPHYVLSGSSLGITALANLLVIGLIWILESGRFLAHTSTKLRPDRADRPGAPGRARRRPGETPRTQGRQPGGRPRGLPQGCRLHQGLLYPGEGTDRHHRHADEGQGFR